MIEVAVGCITFTKCREPNGSFKLLGIAMPDGRGIQTLHVPDFSIRYVINRVRIRLDRLFSMLRPRSATNLNAKQHDIKTTRPRNLAL